MASKLLGILHILFALVLLAVPAGVRAQADRTIAAIRAEVASINKNAPRYTKRTRQVDGFSLEGTEAVYFTSGRGLKKITAKMYGETFRAVTELYFSGEELIFAFLRHERYDTHIAMNPPPKVVAVTDTRLYFADRRAVRILEGGKTLASGSLAFSEKEMEIKDLADALKAAGSRGSAASGRQAN